MFIEQPPWLFRALYPQAILRMDPNERAVYLTFDDGPIPEVTPWVLEVLEKHHIKATFFMVGDNIRKHPDEYRMVVEHGHRIGNHTFNHIRGFEYSNPDYLANARKVDEIIHSDLFLFQEFNGTRKCILQVTIIPGLQRIMESDDGTVACIALHIVQYLKEEGYEFKVL